MCPACHEPLVVFELEGVEVDHCPACLGTWLDAGEVELIAERAGVKVDAVREALRTGRSTDRVTAEYGAKEAAAEARAAGARVGDAREPGKSSSKVGEAGGKRRCPRCRGRLELVVVGSPARPIEIDRCPRGDGLWFDSRELAAVVTALAPPEQVPGVARFFSEIFRQELGSLTKGE